MGFFWKLEKSWRKLKFVTASHHQLEPRKQYRKGIFDAAEAAASEYRKRSGFGVELLHGGGAFQLILDLQRRALWPNAGLQQPAIGQNN